MDEIEEDVSRKEVSESGDFLAKLEEDGVSYFAYSDRIEMDKNENREIIFELDQSVNQEAGSEIYFVAEEPNLRLSPNNKVLFFDYFKGMSSCFLGGVEVDSGEFLWEGKIGCGAEIFWSPDFRQVAFVWNHYDGLNLSVTNEDNTNSVEEIFQQVYYPSEMENTQFYWESNEEFIFEPNSEYGDIVRDSFEEKGLSLELNKFKVR